MRTPLNLSPPTHPVASLAELFKGRPSADGLALLHWPGMELTYNARGALLQVCEEIASRSGGGEVLLPAFHCPSGISPVLAAGLKPVFYRIRTDLSVDFDDLHSKVTSRTVAVLIIHFFGRQTDVQPLEGLQHRGIALIEDCSHTPLRLSPLGPAGQTESFRVFSFWKHWPSFVGGGLIRPPGWEARRASRRPRPPFSDSLRRGKRMIEDAMVLKGTPMQRRAFQALEALRLRLKGVPSGPTNNSEGHAAILDVETLYPLNPALSQCRMPWLSRRVIATSNLREMVERRRRNFQVYAGQLAASALWTPLFPSLGVQDCPWVFPGLLERRDQIDIGWRRAGVPLHTFGIVLHPSLWEVADSRSASEARWLSERLLCLAVHQDLDEQQVARACTTIRAGLEVLEAS